MKSSACALTLAAACLISTLDLTAAYHKTVRCIPGTGTTVPPQLAYDDEEPDYRRRALLRKRRLYTKVRWVNCQQPDASASASASARASASANSPSAGASAFATASASAHAHGGEGEGYRILYSKDHHHHPEDGEEDEEGSMGDEGEIPPMAQMGMAEHATPDEGGVATHGYRRLYQKDFNDYYGGYNAAQYYPAQAQGVANQAIWNAHNVAQNAVHNAMQYGY